MKLTDRFNRKNPTVIHKFIGQPQALEELRKLNDSIAKTKEKQTIHFLANRSHWVNLEATKIWKKRREDNYPKPTPPKGYNTYSLRCRDEASQRVDLRMKAREKALKNTGISMQKQLLDYYRPKKNKKHLLQEIKKINHRASRVENMAKKFFERDSRKWMEIAQVRRLRNPERDRIINDKFEYRLYRVRKAKENEIYRAFERHGVAPKKTLEHDFNHEQRMSSH